MIFEYATLKLIWFALIGTLLIAFAITGGFDLGVCALLPFFGKNDLERRLMLKSIGPTWEGNQVWFICAIAATFAAWPLVYAALFSSFYISLLLILIPLILRPPGIDFRSKLPSPTWRTIWDSCLFLSGSIPVFLFGVIFGNLLQGIDFNYDSNLMPHMHSSFFLLFTPYTFIFGVISLSIILLHGSLFLQIKTVIPLNERARKTARYFAGLFIFSFLIAWIWTIGKVEGFSITQMPDPNLSLTPLSKQVTKEVGLWLKNYQKYPVGYLAPLFSVLGVILAIIFSTLRWTLVAFFSNSIALISTIITAGFTLFPFILPSTSFPDHSLTIWDTTSSKLTLTWMFWALVILLPIVLSYTLWVFKVMRGKVKEAESY